MKEQLLKLADDMDNAQIVAIMNCNNQCVVRAKDLADFASRLRNIVQAYDSPFAHLSETAKEALAMAGQKREEVANTGPRLPRECPMPEFEKCRNWSCAHSRIDFTYRGGDSHFRCDLGNKD